MAICPPHFYSDRFCFDRYSFFLSIVKELPCSSGLGCRRSLTVRKLSFRDFHCQAPPLLRRNSRRRRSRIVNSAACIEVLETKSLLSVTVMNDSITLTHTTPMMTQSQTTFPVYVGDIMNPTPFTVAITTPPTIGSVADNGNGTFTYTSFLNQAGSDSFTFSVTELVPGALPQYGTVNVTVTNSTNALDDQIFVPIASTAVITIPVLANDPDTEGDQQTVISVVSLGDGTASTDGTYVYYTPPSDPSNGTIEAKQELFVKLKYTIKDAAGAEAFAFVKNAVGDEFVGYRNYSRGNDDPAEEIYETAGIKVYMIAHHSTNDIEIQYIATASTNRKWRDSGLYEGQYFAENHLVRLFASEGNNGDAVAPGTPSNELQYLPDAIPDLGIGGKMEGILTVGHFIEGDTIASGTAVIQVVENIGGVWHYDGPARERIGWSLKIRNTGNDERFTISFTVAEVVVPPIPPTPQDPNPPPPRLDTPLREGKHDLYLTIDAKGTMQTPYPKRVMQLLRDRTAATNDLRRPASPPPDWDLFIPNDGLPYTAL